MYHHFVFYVPFCYALSMKKSHELLDRWFQENKRSFPWRDGRNVYLVVVSEFMLQQTRACVVIPYFLRWIEKFPTFTELSTASEEEVIKMWEGLGYYSRARNLHNIAKVVVEKYGGQLPNSIEEILSLKGIGTYTAAAISHLGFQKKALGADANIKKVIARLYGLEGHSIDRKVLQCLDDFLPEKVDDSFEALIELGATLCSKEPDCLSCPLSSSCKAFETGQQKMIPAVKKREKTVPIFHLVYLLEKNGKFAVKKQTKKLMNGLYEFVAIDSVDTTCADHAREILCEKFKIEPKLTYTGKQVQFFTKYKASLHVFSCTLSEKEEVCSSYELIEKKALRSLAFNSGHKKILERFIY